MSWPPGGTLPVGWTYEQYGAGGAPLSLPAVSIDPDVGFAGDSPSVKLALSDPAARFILVHLGPLTVSTATPVSLKTKSVDLESVRVSTELLVLASPAEFDGSWYESDTVVSAGGGWDEHSVTVPPGTWHLAVIVWRQGGGEWADYPVWLDDPVGFSVVDSGPAAVTLPLVVTQVSSAQAVTLPLVVTQASSAQAAALPLRVVQSAPRACALPVKVSVQPSAVTAGLDGAGAWSAAPTGKWSLAVTLGGADISDRVSGACTVRIADNAARTASLSFLPAGVLAPMSLVGQRVTVAFVGAAVVQPVFAGVIDVPRIDLQSGLVSCECTDQAQEVWSNTPRETIDELVGGRWSEAVSGAAEDGFDYLSARIESVGASWALDVQQSPRVLKWAEQSRTLTVRAADVIDGSLSIDLPSRRQLRTRITARLQHRYPVLRQRGIVARYRQNYEWFAPEITAGIGITRPTRRWLLASHVEGAARSLSGWTVQSLEIEHPPAGSRNISPSDGDPHFFIISPSVAPALALGFVSTYSARWQQSVTEDYAITVVWSDLESQLGGPVPDEFGASIESQFDQPDWSRDETIAPYLDAPSIGDARLPWHPAGYSAADRDAALRTLLDRAWVRLWSASRTGRVRFALPCRPDLWLDTSVLLECDRVRASGKIVEVEHTLDTATGSAVTVVALAVGMPGAAPADHPVWALPPAPTDTYTPPVDAYSCEIGTFVGGAAESPPWDAEQMVGFSTNIEGSLPGVEYYPHQLRIRAPDLAAEDRDPLVMPVEVELSVSIPTSSLELL